MLVAIHQPNYLPWPGFFHKWLLADAIVILDTVQFHKNEWQNRNRIKTGQGAQWLTVPVTYRFPQTVREVGIAPEPWVRRHCAAIEQAYARAPFLVDYWPDLKKIIMTPHERLAPLNAALIKQLGDMLGCTAPVYLASKMDVKTDNPTQRLIDLCKEAGGNAYLSGREGYNYLDREAFSDAEVVLWFQEVEAPVYPQLHGEFISHLSVIDLLFNLGPEASGIVRKMGEITQ
ncbi:MAG: WbqC family protein [Mariprofundaceae bacterium]